MDHISPSGTVLVVEDNDQVRRFEVLALRDAGFDVLEAKGGREALQVLRTSSGRIRILLTDVVMPNMTGIDLARAAYHAQSHIRILFISGYSAEILGHAALAQVPHEFLEKPFSGARLVDCVLRLLGREPRGFPEVAPATI